MHLGKVLQYHVDYDPTKEYDWYVAYTGIISDEIYAIQYLHCVNALTIELANLVIVPDLEEKYNEKIKVQKIYQADCTEEEFTLLDNMIQKYCSRKLSDFNTLLVTYNEEGNYTISGDPI